MTTGFLIGVLPVLIVALLIERFVIRRRRVAAEVIIADGLEAQRTAQSLALTCAHDAARRDLQMRAYREMVAPMASTMLALQHTDISLPSAAQLLDRDFPAAERTTPDTARGIGGSGGGEHRHSQGSNPGVEQFAAQPPLTHSNLSAIVGSHNPPEHSPAHPPVHVRGRISGGALTTLDCTTCGDDLVPHLADALVNGCPSCRRRRSIAVVPSVLAPTSGSRARIA